MRTRRGFLGAIGGGALAQERRGEALIAITLDMEMSRNFPVWEETRWDYEKGNLDEAAKRYTVEACRRVKSAGGVVHCFVVGQVLEHASVAWLEEIVREGHPVGNHTYDHANVTAARIEDVQFRFRRAPWLVEGKSAAEAIRDNVVLNERAMKSRLGIAPAGFRTPGGFARGLGDHVAVQRMLLDLGYRWVSSKAGGPATVAGAEPTAAVVEAFVKAQAEFQPYRYGSGLVEVPMSPPSDIQAFRNGRWKLEWFLAAVRGAVEWAIRERATFDLLAHPSCLGVVDPGFRVIDMICELVAGSRGAARLVGLEELARRAG